MTVVIVRKDLAERADKNLPTLLQYRTHIKEKSLYHTPPTFAVYILGLVTEWIAAEGGIAGIAETQRSQSQASLRHDGQQRRLLSLPGGEIFALADERGVSRGAAEMRPSKSSLPRTLPPRDLIGTPGIAPLAECASRCIMPWGSTR